MAEKKRFLMCRPSHYEVAYVINPWMSGNVGRTDRSEAAKEWENLRAILSRSAEVVVMDQPPGLPDMVFTANAGLVLENEAVLSHFAYYQRRPEEPLFREWFRMAGYNLHILPRDILFEGAGDALFEPGGKRLWASYGQRSSLEAHPYLSRIFDVEVVSLRLVDPRYYHLDTCFCPLPEGHLIYYPDAFDKRSGGIIESLVPAKKRIALSPEDAQAFAGNAVCANGMVVVSRCSTDLKLRLKELGFETVETSLDEYLKSGGSAKCLTLLLNERLSPRREVFSGVVGRKLIAEGHLVDSPILGKICAAIVDSGGAAGVRDVRLGLKQQDSSRAEIEILAPDDRILDEIVQAAIRNGARFPAGGAADARLEPVARDGSAPDNFYATTIYPTEVRVKGQWHMVHDLRMDGAIVVSEGITRCTLLRNLRKGDMVVTGGDGVMVTESHREYFGPERFGFMTSPASSERPAEAVLERLAWEMRRIKNHDGKIVVVAGPVAVHAGGMSHLAWMARNGYVNALLGGNGLAVHDLEASIFGTSLGVDLATGSVREGGHRNHLATINLIRRAGGIKAAVEKGVVTGGLFHDLIRNNIPFSLAGSIRDDGPLPETEMDLIKAQDNYFRFIQGTDMILVLASMLHAIGTGNMTPAGTKLICVDINPAVVTKLTDRGSLESVGVVAEVGLFLAQLEQTLRKFG